MYLYNFATKLQQDCLHLPTGVSTLPCEMQRLSSCSQKFCTANRSWPASSTQCTISNGFGRHGMPPPVCNPYLWPFDIETGVRVASKVGNLHSKFGHDKPLGSRIIRYVRDGRTKSTLTAPVPTVGGTTTVNSRFRESHSIYNSWPNRWRDDGRAWFTAAVVCNACFVTRWQDSCICWLNAIVSRFTMIWT